MDDEYAKVEIGGEPYQVSNQGVLIGDVVISVVNGSLCANRIGVAPTAIDFGAYIWDVLPTEGVALVEFNSDTLRYELGCIEYHCSGRAIEHVVGSAECSWVLSPDGGIESR